MFDTSTLNFNSILNKFAAAAWSQFSFFDEQMNRCIFRYEIDEIGKNQDKSIKKTSVSSISTDWSIQSISIKSDLPIFIDLSIFFDWLLRDHCQHLAVVTEAKGTRPAATVPQLCRRNGSRPCCGELSWPAFNDTICELTTLHILFGLI